MSPPLDKPIARPWQAHRRRGGARDSYLLEWTTLLVRRSRSPYPSNRPLEFTFLGHSIVRLVDTPYAILKVPALRRQALHILKTSVRDPPPRKPTSRPTLTL
jgi:hypothetical protein